MSYVTDRPGHDRRYSLGSEKVRALGWEAQVRFAEGLEQTVALVPRQPRWWEPIRSGDYRAYYERQYGSRSRTERRESASSRSESILQALPSRSSSSVSVFSFEPVPE